MNLRILALLAISTLPLAAHTGYAQTINVNKDNRTIAVTATEEASAPADLAIVTIGFETFGADQTQTYADATRISNAIMDALHATGIAGDAIESKTQSLTSIGDDDKLRFAKGIRFHFSQSWAVTVPAAAAADTIHTGVLAGANQSGDIQWQMKSVEALEAAAAEKALTRARMIADRIAKGLGTKVGPLVYASNQVPPRVPFAGMLQTESAEMVVAIQKRNLKPLAIVPEKLTRSSTVYAVFAIE